MTLGIKTFEEFNLSDYEIGEEDNIDQLKDAVQEIVDNNVGEDKEREKEFIKNLKEDGLDGVNLKGFIQDNDVYDFYIKYQFEIDKTLNENDWFAMKPVDLGIDSAYDYLLVSCKKGFELILFDILNIEQSEEES